MKNVVALAAAFLLTASPAAFGAGNQMSGGFGGGVHTVAAKFSVTPATRASELNRLLHKAGGYCNAYGCFGNICYTPIGWCRQVNFSPVGGSCVCPGQGYGETGS